MSEKIAVLSGKSEKVRGILAMLGAAGSCIVVVSEQERDTVEVAISEAGFESRYRLSGEELRSMKEEPKTADVPKDRRKAWQTCHGPAMRGVLRK